LLYSNSKKINKQTKIQEDSGDLVIFLSRIYLN